MYMTIHQCTMVYLASTLGQRPHQHARSAILTSQSKKGSVCSCRIPQPLPVIPSTKDFSLLLQKKAFPIHMVEKRRQQIVPSWLSLLLLLLNTRDFLAMREVFFCKISGTPIIVNRRQGLGIHLLSSKTCHQIIFIFWSSTFFGKSSPL